MKKNLKEFMAHWVKYRCWRCGVHSADNRKTRMIELGNGYICEKCYKELFES